MGTHTPCTPCPRGSPVLKWKTRESPWSQSPPGSISQAPWRSERLRPLCLASLSSGPQGPSPLHWYPGAQRHLPGDPLTTPALKGHLPPCGAWLILSRVTWPHHAPLSHLIPTNNWPLVCFSALSFSPKPLLGDAKCLQAENASPLRPHKPEMVSSIPSLL